MGISSERARELAHERKRKYIEEFGEAAYYEMMTNRARRGGYASRGGGFAKSRELAVKAAYKSVEARRKKREQH